MNWLKGLMIAIAISYSIAMIWEFIECLQFGEIQHGRICDDIVYILYFIVLWIGFSRW